MSRSRLLTLRQLAVTFAFWTAFSVAVCAESRRSGPPTFECAPFPLPFGRFSISGHSGLPAGQAQLIDKTPFPDDFPPHVSIIFEDKRPYPSLEERPIYGSVAGNQIYVFRISDVDAAPYETIKSEIAKLRQLLRARPKLASPTQEENHRNFPYYPPTNAGHAFYAKVSYVDADWGAGICFLTQFTQEWPHYANNEDLTMVFQGISKNDKFYVSVTIRLTHPGLATGRLERYREKGIERPDDTIFLNLQADDSFTPALADIRTWITSFHIE